MNGVDVSALGAAYGTGRGRELPEHIDVGPTTDNSTNALPTTDNAIQFEDLIIFAINYGEVSKPGVRPEPAERNALTMSVSDLPGVGGTFVVKLRLESDGGILGLSVPLVWDAGVVEPVGAVAGELLGRQGIPAVRLSPEPGTVDVAGLGSALAGEGVLAEVEFRVVGSGTPGLGVGEVTARDAENRALPLGVDGWDRRSRAARRDPAPGRHPQPVPGRHRRSIRPGEGEPGSGGDLRSAGETDPDPGGRNVPRGRSGGVLGRPRRPGTAGGRGTLPGAVHNAAYHRHPERGQAGLM